MGIRKPAATQAARAATAFLQTKGINVKHQDALELVAIINGFSSYDVMSAQFGASGKSAVPISSPDLSQLSPDDWRAAFDAVMWIDSSRQKDADWWRKPDSREINQRDALSSEERVANGVRAFNTVYAAFMQHWGDEKLQAGYWAMLNPHLAVDLKPEYSQHTMAELYGILLHFAMRHAENAAAAASAFARCEQLGRSHPLYTQVLFGARRLDGSVIFEASRKPIPESVIAMWRGSPELKWRHAQVAAGATYYSNIILVPAGSIRASAPLSSFVCQGLAMQETTTMLTSHDFKQLDAAGRQFFQADEAATQEVLADIITWLRGEGIKVRPPQTKPQLPGQW